MKKVVIIIGIVALAILAALVYWPKDIDLEYQCIEFDIGTEEYRDIDVKIKGTVYRSLFRPDYCETELMIGDEPFPNYNNHETIISFDYDYGVEDLDSYLLKEEKYKTHLSGSFRYDIINLQYRYVKDSSIEHYIYGNLFLPILSSPKH